MLIIRVAVQSELALAGWEDANSQLASTVKQAIDWLQVGPITAATCPQAATRRLPPAGRASAAIGTRGPPDVWTACRPPSPRMHEDASTARAAG